MPSQQAIIDEARRWLGTPFRHQARVLGMGVDCAGLVVCTAQALGIDGSFQEVPYGRYPHARTLERLCNAHLDRIPAHGAQPGDVLLFAWHTEPQHLGIKTDIGVIHSHASAGKVVEHSLDPIWRSRIRGAFRFRGLA